MMGVINGSHVTQFLGYPIVGALGGLGMGALNQNFSNNIYGNSSNDPFIGANWDFVLTGASIGGGVALASAGIKYQAQQLKAQRMNDIVRHFQDTAVLTQYEKEMLYKAGMK